MNYDYKIKQRQDDTWVVLDQDGFKVAGPFNTPIAAAGWARDRIIRKAVRKWNGDRDKREEKRS